MEEKPIDSKLENNDTSLDQEPAYYNQRSLALMSISGKKAMDIWLGKPVNWHFDLVLNEQDYFLSRRVYAAVMGNVPFYSLRKDTSTRSIRQLEANIPLQERIIAGVNAEEQLLRLHRPLIERSAKQLSEEIEVDPEEIIPLLQIGRIMAIRSYEGKKASLWQHLRTTSERYARIKIRKGEEETGVMAYEPFYDEFKIPGTNKPYETVFKEAYLSPFEREIYLMRSALGMTIEEIKEEVGLESQVPLVSAFKRANIRIKNYLEGTSTIHSRKHTINKKQFDLEDLRLIMKYTGISWEGLFDVEEVLRSEIDPFILIGEQNELKKVGQLLQKLKSGYGLDN